MKSFSSQNLLLEFLLMHLKVSISINHSFLPASFQAAAFKTVSFSVHSVGLTKHERARYSVLCIGIIQLQDLLKMHYDNFLL